MEGAPAFYMGLRARFSVWLAPSCAKPIWVRKYPRSPDKSVRRVVPIVDYEGGGFGDQVHRAGPAQGLHSRLRMES